MVASSSGKLTNIANKLPHSPSTLSFHIDITYSHVCSTYSYISQVSHTNIHWTLTNRISIVNDFVQFVVHLCSHIDMTQLHIYGTLTLSHYFLYNYMWTCLLIYTSWWILVILAHLLMHMDHLHSLVYITHLVAHLHDTLTNLWENLHSHVHFTSAHQILHAHLHFIVTLEDFHITSLCEIVGSHGKYTRMVHTMTHTLHNLQTWFFPQTYIFMT